MCNDLTVVPLGRSHIWKIFVFNGYSEDSQDVAKADTGECYAPVSQHPSTLISYTTWYNIKTEKRMGTMHRADSGLALIRAGVCEDKL